jgi:hypothetical protein
MMLTDPLIGCSAARIRAFVPADGGPDGTVAGDPPPAHPVASKTPAVAQAAKNRAMYIGTMNLTL